MSIAVRILDKDPRGLAELIAKTMSADGAVVDREPSVAHLSALLSAEERDAVMRRAAWHWLNSISSSVVDVDNDWSDV